MSSLSPGLSRLVVDLATGDPTGFESLLSEVRGKDKLAQGQKFDTLQLGVITYSEISVYAFVDKRYTIGGLGPINRDLDRVIDILRQQLGLPPLNTVIGRDLQKAATSDPGSKARIAGRTSPSKMPVASRPPQMAPPAFRAMLADTAPADPWQIRVCNLGRAVRQLTGKGIALGIVDSGVDTNHPALQTVGIAAVNIISDGYLVTPVPAQQVPNGNEHGTTIASIIVGRDPTGERLGIAPDCTFHCTGVASGDLAWDDAQLIAAIEWLAQRKVRVLNLSLSAGEKLVGGHEIILNAARRVGMLPIAAIGNKGCNIVSTPGLCPSALSIGALSAADTVELTSGCAPVSDASKPALPKLLAPGLLRVAISPEHTIRDSTAATSFAAAYVSGIVALLLEACPTAKVDQLEAALLQSPTVSLPHPASACAGTKVPILDFEAALDTLRHFGLPCRDLS